MLRTLGGLEVDGSDFHRPKPLLLLAYLTLEGAQLRSHLAELFWPHNPQANRSLTTTLGRLRKAVPGLVQADETRVGCALSSDVKELRRSLADGELEGAMALYRGPFLDGHELPRGNAELEEWVYDQRETIAEELRATLLHRGKLAAGRGQFDVAAAWAARAVTLPGAAAPEPQTLSLSHALLLADNHPLAARLETEAAEYGLLLSDTPAAALAALESPQHEATPHNLPARGGPFVGRDIELSELHLALVASDRRLLSLIGPGGTGKTRLALQVAREVLETFAGGVYFVGLEAAEDVAAATGAIAEAVGADPSAGSDPVARVSRALAGKRCLLVLDNLEQLVGGAGLVAALLERCANLKVVVTSRERLDLAAEWVVPVDGLAYPDSDLAADEAQAFDAVRLFALRAGQAAPGFELSDEDLPHVTRLCRLLGGAPLGLELGAAWTRVLSVKEIADEAERTLDFLVRRSPSENPRHQSLRAAFAHSWLLLVPDERSMLGGLSVFRGGFDRAAAAAVTSGSVATLLSLIDKSLVYPLADERFDLHAATKQYAHEQLVADGTAGQAAGRRHAEHFMALAEAAEPRLKGPEQAVWLARLARERDNLRVALNWSLAEQQAELGLRLASALQQFWWLRGPYQEGYGYLTRLLDLPAAAKLPRLRGKALHRAGTLCQELGDYAEADAHYRAAQELAEANDDQQLLADALHSRGLLASKLGAWDEGRTYYQRCLALQREIEDDWGHSVTLNNMALNEAFAGRFPRARDMLLDSLALKEELGDTQGIAYSLNNLGTVTLHLGDLSAAKGYVKRSLALKEKLEDGAGVASSLANLGRIAGREAGDGGVRSGAELVGGGRAGAAFFGGGRAAETPAKALTGDARRFEEARELLRRSLRTLAPLDNSWSLAWVLTAVVELESRAGRPLLALRLAGGVDALCAAFEVVIPAMNAAELEAGKCLATATVGADVAEEMLREGRRLGVGEIIELACAEVEGVGT